MEIQTATSLHDMFKFYLWTSLYSKFQIEICLSVNWETIGSYYGIESYIEFAFIHLLDLSQM